jgi:thymidylate synthase
MMEIIADSADQLFVKISRRLIYQPILEVRGLKTKELFLQSFCLINPINSFVTLKSRNASKNYLEKEMSWYMSGSLKASDISSASSVWDKLKDENGLVQSNYGRFVFHQGQFDWCLKRLKEDVNTRQALINYNQLEHKKEGTKDFPCTISQSFVFRENSLHSIVFMRSCDVIYGLTYDLPWFSSVLIELSSELGLNVGNIYYTGISLHVYERHFNMIEEISKERI